MNQTGKVAVDKISLGIPLGEVKSSLLRFSDFWESMVLEKLQPLKCLQEMKFIPMELHILMDLIWQINKNKPTNI